MLSSIPLASRFLRSLGTLPLSRTAFIGVRSASTTNDDMAAECGVCVNEGLAAAAGDEKPRGRKLDSATDEEILRLMSDSKVKHHELEDRLENKERAVIIRRKFVELSLIKRQALGGLPYENYDYQGIWKANCENVIGYVPIPVGIAGPLLLDGKEFTIPMATTEGCLIASTHRGCKAISESGGAVSALLNDAMSRGPVVQLPNALRAAAMKGWIRQPENFSRLAEAFNSTSRFARLAEIRAAVSGRNVYLRCKSTTGDAMGMNMLTKGVTKLMDVLQAEFPDMDLLSVSGNYCTDKKPSAINWVDGRGKSVVVEAVIKKSIVEKTLKTTVDGLVKLNVNKNLIGSAMAGSVGGFNAHASNIVTAVFLATGQDPAQNIESSNCMTLMEATDKGDLRISVTMPSIEVGTIGGGTTLPAQAACLEMLGVRGSNLEQPGANAGQLSRVIAAATLAGELSLMSALTAGHLLKSHMELNRKK